MTVVQSIGWEKEPILDDSHTTYLYTRVRGSFIATYNPGAVSFDPPVGQAVPLPVARAR